MLARPMVTDGGLQRQALGGDLVHTGERIDTLTTVGAGTILAASIAAGILRRTGPVGGYTDTFDSATNIINALGGSGVPLQGCSWRFTFINGVAQAMTAAAGEGIVLGTNVNAAASIVRTYLLTVTNDTARQVFIVGTTNASPTVTGFTKAQLDLLSVGQMVSGTGITAGTTISAINIAAGTITLSGNATATNASVALTFSPVINISGLGVMTA